jgi:lambda repressor-like predicted transcriptional regulator
MLINFKDLTKDQQESNGKTLIDVGEHQFSISLKLLDLVDAVKNNSTVHWVSDGDWSMHELLLALVRGWENTEVHLSSYAFSEKPARILADLVRQGTILNLYCLVDNRIDTRSASALTLVQNCSRKTKLIATHAKVTVIDVWNKSYTVIGSANYTENKRYEAGIVSSSRDVSEFHKKWMQDELNRVD